MLYIQWQSRKQVPFECSKQYYSSGVLIDSMCMLSVLYCVLLFSYETYTVADLGGGGVRGVQMHAKNLDVPQHPLVMYFCTAQVHQMIKQQWNAATTTRHSYTLTYMFLTDLQTFD